MWRRFFEELGFEIVVSPSTNKAILDMGIDSSIDESCTSSKIYMGHVQWLIGKCDYILVPRVVSYPDGDITCTKFHGQYDICRATFPEAKFLHYNIDYANGHTTFNAYKKMAEELGIKGSAVRAAFDLAQKTLAEYENKLEDQQDKLMQEDKLKVLVVAHPYNIYDKLIGEPVVKALEALNVNVIYGDVPNTAVMCDLSKQLSASAYWKYNKELIGAVCHYRDKIDGMVFLATFPCGPDSLAIELLVRKLGEIPMTTLVADSNFGEAGLQTRVESFIDIIEARKKGGF